MSADGVFAVIVFIAVFGGWGFSAYQHSGIDGVKHFIYGILSAVAFFTVIIAVHIVTHCVMETCGDSMFYSLLA